MKHSILFILFVFSALCCYAQQEKFDSVRISGYIPVEHSDHIDWIKRYQGDIDKYNQENKHITDFSCDALFFGSSSINLWQNLHNDMSPLRIIKRSYGGASIRDMLYNYNTIARGYKPKSIVLYVENDFCSCKEGITVGETYDLFRLFIQRIQTDYPDIPLFIISFKPSFAKWDQLEQQKMMNSLLKDYSEHTHNVHYIDITQDMYDTDGKLRKDIFESDNLHINQKGYDMWTQRIKPHLMKIYNQ